MIRGSVVVVAGLLVWSGTGLAQAPAPPPPAAGGSRSVPPTVRVTVDRTAVWVGDRVTYTVDIACPRGIDVLEDDLAKDKLKLDGLEVFATDASRTEDADQAATRRFTYVLTTFKVNQPSLRVAPFTVRYYVTRPGQRLQESAPAGEVQVPGAVVALRSMLPEEQETFALRDRRPSSMRPAFYRLAQPIGIALVVIAIAPAAFWGLALFARYRSRQAARSGRKVRKDERASLEAARALDVATADGRREAYTQIDGVVRDHLQHASAVPGRSLTPQEIGPALAGRGSRVPAESVAALLDECERARYAPADRMPSAEACREALSLAEQIVSSRR